MPSQRFRLGRTVLIAAFITWFFGLSIPSIILGLVSGYLIFTSSDV